jgi:hypothetical protein
VRAYFSHDESEVLKAVIMKCKFSVFSDMKTYSEAGVDRRFAGTYCLLLQQLGASFLPVACLAHSDRETRGNKFLQHFTKFLLDCTASHLTYKSFQVVGLFPDSLSVQVGAGLQSFLFPYKKNSVALVRKRTIPTERPPLSAK